MALRYSQITTELREVSLANKPDELLNISKKGTVPVLQLEDGTVLHESLDIMKWALNISDPDNWLLNQDINRQNDAIELINKNDNIFKDHLDHYKYADRFPEHDLQYYRQKCEVFLNHYNTMLSKHAFLSDSHISIADIAIFPFIRQCAFVDKDWFDHSSYNNLQNWLAFFLKTDLFISVMDKHPPFNEAKIKTHV